MFTWCCYCIDVNKWDLIFDFTKKEDNQLNYSFLDPAEFKIITKTLDDMDAKPVMPFPYPEKYGGKQADDATQHSHDDHGDMMAFKIGVSAKDAEK